jgi:glutathione reductase (NADPH)
LKTGDTSTWFSNSSVASPYGGFKILSDPQTDRILGAHVFGIHAEEVINLFALAVRRGLKREDLKHMIYAYPTSSSDVPYMLG